MPSGLCRMVTVDVQQVNALWLEAIARGIEARSDQSRESRVMRTVMLINVGEGGLVVAAGVGVAAPVIDRKTTRASLVLQR